MQNVRSMIDRTYPELQNHILEIQNAWNWCGHCYIDLTIRPNWRCTKTSHVIHLTEDFYRLIIPLNQSIVKDHLKRAMNYERKWYERLNQEEQSLALKKLSALLRNDIPSFQIDLVENLIAQNWPGQFPLDIYEISVAVIAVNGVDPLYLDQILDILAKHQVRFKVNQNKTRLAKKIKLIREQAIAYTILVGPAEQQQDSIQWITTSGMKKSILPLSQLAKHILNHKSWRLFDTDEAKRDHLKDE